MKLRVGVILLTLIAAAVLSAAPVGAIKGYVLDASGATVPGASVILLSADTNQSWKAASDSTGFFQFQQLQPGRYEVSAEAAGFRKTTVKNITVLVDQIVSVDVHLALGQVSEVVEVTGNRHGLDRDGEDRHWYEPGAEQGPEPADWQ